MTARTITLAELEARVPDATDIELPGPEGGWAVAVINGREYRARVAPAAVERGLFGALVDLASEVARSEAREERGTGGEDR